MLVWIGMYDTARIAMICEVYSTSWLQIAIWTIVPRTCCGFTTCIPSQLRVRNIDIRNWEDKRGRESLLAR